MKYQLLAIIISLFIFSFKFGTREGTLTCKSESGRTLFNAKNDAVYVIFDPTNEVYTIYLKSSAGIRFVRFWAIPSTFKLVSTDGKRSLPHEIYSFKAKIFGKEPRTGFGFNSKVIDLDCTLELE